MRGKNSSPAVDLLDVATMKDSMVSRWGGGIYIDVSVYSAKPTAAHITVWWSADGLSEQSTSVIAAAGLCVRSVAPTLDGAFLPAFLYRLLWELDVKIAGELGDDAQW